MVLTDILVWLKKMEDLAHDVYRKAARQSGYSEALTKILRQMAKDEAHHADLLNGILETVHRIPEPDLDAVVVDPETRFHIENDFRVLDGKIEHHDLSERELIQAVVDLEFSEWNPIFCYVLTRCQHHSRLLQKAASEIQSHEEHLERFVAGLPEALQPDRQLRQLPKIWEQSILVADDEEPLLVLYQQLLARYGRVATARNGAEALQQIHDSAFDLILTDARMPDLSGEELFWQAIQFDPDLADRFIFCTATVADLSAALLQNHNVAVLEKPFSIRRIMQTVEQVLRRRHTERMEGGAET